MSDVTIRKPRRGWSSQHLTVVPLLDERYWSVFDAAELLGPLKLTQKQVHSLIDLVKLKPVGKRPNGPKMRHVPVYLAEDLIRFHKKLMEMTGDAD